MSSKKPELIMIAKGLKNLRVQKGLTQPELNVAIYAVSNIESAKRYCSMATYETIAESLGMNVLEFFSYCYNNYEI